MPDRRVTIILGADVAGYVSGVKTAADQTVRLVGTLDSASGASTKAASAVEQGTDRMQRGFSRSAVASALFSGNLLKAGQIAAGVFTAQAFIRGIGLVESGIRGIVNAGADWTESITKTQFAFGAAANGIITQAQQMGQTLGVNEQVFLDNATNIGLIGKAAGLTAPEAAAMGSQFAKLATDVSSFYNVPVKDALDAIQSGLVGQERPLRQYGVLLDQAAVQNEAVALGIVHEGQAMTQQAAVIARASLITKGFADANGDLARTQDSLANRMRAISGHIHNFAIALGEDAQPAILSVLSAAGRLGHDGLDLLAATSDRLGPTWHDIANVGRDLGPIFSSAAKVAGPLAAAFVLIAASGVGAILAVIAQGLGLITGFLAQHQGVVEALTVLLLTRYVPALLMSVGSGIVSGLQAIAVALLGDEAAAATAAAGLDVFAGSEAAVATGARGLVGSLGGVGGALAGFATVGAGFELVSTLQHANAAAKQLITTLAQGIDLKTPQGLEDYRKKLDDAAASANQLGSSEKGLGGFLAETGRLLTPLSDDAYNAQQAHGQLSSKSEEVAKAHNNLTAHLSEASRNFGLNQQQALRLAQIYGIDLTKAGGSVTAALAAAAAQAKITGVALDDEAESRQKAVADANSAALDSSNILSTIVDRHNALEQAQKKAATSGQTESEREHSIQAAYLGVESAQARVIDSTLKLDDLRNGGQQREIDQAERDVAAAYAATQRAVFQVLDATRALEDARRAASEGRTVAEAEIAVGRAADAQAQSIADVAAAQAKLNYAREVGIADEVAQATREYNETLRRQTEAGFSAEDAQVALNRAQQDSTGNNREVEQAQMNLADATTAVSTAQDQQAQTTKALNDLLNGGLAREMAAADLELRQAVLGVGQAEDSVAAALRKANTEADDTATKFDVAKVSLSEFRAELEKQITATLNWDVDLAKVPDDVAGYFRKMGVQSAPLLHQLVTGNKSEFDQIVGDIRTSTALGSDVFAQNLDAMRTNGVTSMLTAGEQVGGALIESLGGQVGDVASVVGDYLNVTQAQLNTMLAAIGKPPLTGAYNTAPGAASLHYLDNSGKFTLHEKGGIDAHIVSAPTVLYGERQTGAEAFIPKQGISAQRGRDIADTAARWHGGRVVPMATGGVLSSPPDMSRYGFWLGSQSGEAMQFAFEQEAAAYSKSLAAAGGGPVPPGNVSDWITAGMALAHAPAAWLMGLYEIAEHESGGDPHAVNRTDSNARAGNPSEGLMQTTISTFKAYALPSHDDIFNPIDNTAAAIGYIRGRYHDINGVPGVASLAGGHPYLPYAFGGINVFDNGGWLMPGRLGLNMTSTPERVLSPAQTTLYSSGSARPVNSYSIEIQVMAPGGIITDHPTFAKEMKKVVEPAIQRAFDSLATEGDTR